MREHQCPGGCGRRVAYHLFACGPCWHRLPDDLNIAVWRGYRRGAGGPEHTAAISAAAEWYAANPREASA